MMMILPRVQTITAGARDRWRLRRVYRQLLRLMPSDGNMDAFIEAVAAARGRRIVITPVTVGPGEPSGAWRPDVDHDEIRIDRNATPANYVVTMCHEFSHMFLGHDHDDDGHHDIAPPATQWISSDMARRLFLTRDDFDRPSEGDSEQLATRLAFEVRRRQYIAEASADRIGKRLR